MPTRDDGSPNLDRDREGEVGCTATWGLPVAAEAPLNRSHLLLPLPVGGSVIPAGNCNLSRDKDFHVAVWHKEGKVLAWFPRCIWSATVACRTVCLVEPFVGP